MRKSRITERQIVDILKQGEAGVISKAGFERAFECRRPTPLKIAKTFSQKYLRLLGPPNLLSLR